MYTRKHEGLGFWTAVATTAANFAASRLGSGSGNMPSEQYYPAVKAGTLLCPGPFSIDEVAAALRQYPELERMADPVIAMDGAWLPSKYGPLDARGKASALVNWAHGGRNCEVTDGETGATSSAAAVQQILSEAQKRRSIAAQAAQAASSAAGTAGEVVGDAAQTIKQAAQSDVGLLAMLGIAAWAAMRAFQADRR